MNKFVAFEINKQNARIVYFIDIKKFLNINAYSIYDKIPIRFILCNQNIVNYWLDLNHKLPHAILLKLI